MPNYQMLLKTLKGGSDTICTRKRNTTGASDQVSSSGYKSINNEPPSSFIQQINCNATCANLSDLPFFNCNKNEFLTEINEINFRRETDHIKSFKNLNNTDFSILHLNINSLYLKREEIFPILDLNIFYIICLNETKLNETVPNSFFQHPSYQQIRHDRTFSGGGGLNKK